MTDTQLAYYAFCAIVFPIVFIAVRNMYKNFVEGNTLMWLLWFSLLAWAILYWGSVSQQTDADTIAIWWLEGKLRLLWQLIENLGATTNASLL